MFLHINLASLLRTSGDDLSALIERAQVHFCRLSTIYSNQTFKSSINLRDFLTGDFTRRRSNRFDQPEPQPGAKKILGKA
jgi:hypothetical protein